MIVLQKLLRSRYTSAMLLDMNTSLIHGGMKNREERIGLLDAERARIRSSSTKRGFVAVLDFAPGPRGGKFRNERTNARTTRGACEAELAETRRMIRTPIRRVTLIEVDHMGRVQGSEVLS